MRIADGFGGFTGTQIFRMSPRPGASGPRATPPMGVCPAECPTPAVTLSRYRVATRNVRRVGSWVHISEVLESMFPIPRLGDPTQRSTTMNRPKRTDHPPRPGDEPRPMPPPGDQPWPLPRPTA